MKKLSPQAVSKTAQGYRDKPVPPTCGNCKNFKSTLALSAWMVKRNAEGQRKPYSLKTHGRDSAPRCSLGDFSVKKSATCLQFEQKTGGAA